MSKSKRILEMEELVKEEATKLRENATQKEKDILDFEFLDSNHINHCIYGQMTGHCYTARAIQLIEMCAKKVYKSQTEVDQDIKMQDVPLNGSPVNQKRTKYWSPIEVFIIQPYPTTKENNRKLVEFIKGEVDTLEFI